MGVSESLVFPSFFSILSLSLVSISFHLIFQIVDCNFTGNFHRWVHIDTYDSGHLKSLLQSNENTVKDGLWRTILLLNWWISWSTRKYVQFHKNIKIQERYFTKQKITEVKALMFFLLFLFYFFGVFTSWRIVEGREGREICYYGNISVPLVVDFH